MAEDRGHKVDYGKISGAVSGRALSFVDPTLGIKRKAEERELDRKAEMATMAIVGQVAGATASLASSVDANIKSWEDLESGYSAVGGKGALPGGPSGLKGTWKKWMTAAPEGGAYTIAGEGGKLKAFTGTELSKLGTAVKGGYGHSVGTKGKSYWESFGGTLKEGAEGAEVGYSAKGYDPMDITSWGSSSLYNVKGPGKNKTSNDEDDWYTR